MQPIERVLVAREEDVFLVAEVVIEIPLFHVERSGNLLDGRAVIAELAKGRRGALQNLHPHRGFRVGRG